MQYLFIALLISVCAEADVLRLEVLDNFLCDDFKRVVPAVVVLWVLVAPHYLNCAECERLCKSYAGNKDGFSSQCEGARKERQKSVPVESGMSQSFGTCRRLPSHTQYSCPCTSQEGDGLI